jgi:hypothetical protein
VWPFTPRQLANVLWALGQCRHWSDKVPTVEAALLQAGGLLQLTPGELCSALWGCATLNYVPQQLLKQLGAAWAGDAAGQQQQVQQQKKLQKASLRSAGECVWPSAATVSTRRW